jgi:DNA-binding response OmpR family regulator
MLAKEGFETICPDTSEHILRASREEKFDAYLLDSWTPGMSGVELCKKIREHDTHTPIIFYSAAAFQRDKDEAFAAGAQAYITKPATLDEVVYEIRSAISSSNEGYSE